MLIRLKYDNIKEKGPIKCQYYNEQLPNRTSQRIYIHTPKPLPRWKEQQRDPHMDPQVNRNCKIMICPDEKCINIKENMYENQELDWSNIMSTLPPIWM